MRRWFRGFVTFIFLGVMMCSFAMPVNAMERAAERDTEIQREMDNENPYIYKYISSRFYRVPKNIYGKRRPFYKIWLKKHAASAGKSARSGKTSSKKNTAKRKSTVKKKNTMKKKTTKRRKKYQ